MILLVQIGGTADAYGRMFDWEPFTATSTFVSGSEAWEEWKEPVSGNIFEDRPAGPPNGRTSGQAGDSLRLRFSFSRYAASDPHSPLEVHPEINRWSLIQSLPDTLSNAGSNRERFEAIGKVFEPKVSLGIEF